RREKKVVKVQTRSGRVSRPPKYKAKDFKFIKMEDLADSHQSDSDDYSDVSEEDESMRKDTPAPGPGQTHTFSHKFRSHHCQTCDKAYIGPGGLNRHYKLNPTHGDADPPSSSPSSPPPPIRDGAHPQETEDEGAEDEQKEEQPSAACGVGQRPSELAPSCRRSAGGGRTSDGCRTQKPSSPWPARLLRWDSGPAGNLLSDWQVTVGLVSRRGRRGRPPKLSVTTEQQAQRRRERLQELVEQCEDEELMDIVLPRLTKILSAWELLLAKVECGTLAQSQFPDIYREFESLQAQVRRAAHDYILSPQAGAVPLEVRNIEVARSLGILDEVNRMKVVP
uniref:C2H2-type domain-containing protein n=1 Tax=Tetraodon nigroviridis TaxID=99883 RepID=H3C3K2_TETNG